MILKLYNKLSHLLTVLNFFIYGKRHCTRTGYNAAQHTDQWASILHDPSLSLHGKVYLITGANSGLGRELTQYLASKQATVYMICRDYNRGKHALDEIQCATKSDTLHLITADVGLETGVRFLWHEFINHQKASGHQPRLNALICNAGSLSHIFEKTQENVESTFATHLLFGSYLLIQLALQVLRKTTDSRVIVVSSAGMYTQKFPSWDLITGRKGAYDGQIAYAWAKRGQVLLCERLSLLVPEIPFVSCHPGWVDTPGVNAAYGATKVVLMPLRSLWEGVEGIAWLCVAPNKKIQSGSFYLDGAPRPKHIAGLFITEGSSTKNTSSDVDTMMARLERWSSAKTRPAWPVLADKSPLNSPLEPLHDLIHLPDFMGRWYVWAHLPTFLDAGTANNMEDYVLETDGTVRIRFSYVECGGCCFRAIHQTARITNAEKTMWKLAIKFGFQIPVPIPYLICYVDQMYEHTIVGVPNREHVWIMARTPKINEEKLQELYEIAEEVGYDPRRIVRPPVVSDVNELELLQ